MTIKKGIYGRCIQQGHKVSFPDEELLALTAVGREEHSRTGHRARRQHKLASTVVAGGFTKTPTNTHTCYMTIYTVKE